MLNNATIDKLINMKLKVMADTYIVQEQDPAYRDVPFSDRFTMMVDVLYNQRRDNVNVKTYAITQVNAAFQRRDL